MRMSKNIFGWLMLFIVANVEFCDGSNKNEPSIKKATNNITSKKRHAEGSITKTTAVNKVSSNKDTTVTEKQMLKKKSTSS